MEQFSVKLSGLQNRILEEKIIVERLAGIEDNILSIGRGLSFQMKSKYNLQRTIEQLAADVGEARFNMSTMSVVLESIRLKYKNTEDKLCGRESDWTKIENWIDSVGCNIVPIAKSSSPDWAKGALSVMGKFGFGGAVVSTIGNFWRGDKGKFGTWGKAAKDIYNSFKAAKKVDWTNVPWKNTTATGGTKVEWLKKLVGFNIDEIFPGAKAVKNSGALRGVSGLKTGWSEGLKKAKGSVTKGSVIFSAVASAASNIDEYKDAYVNAETAEEKQKIVIRGIEETVVETAVDVGKGVLVTAGVTAVMGALGVASAPVAVVGAAGAAICWGADVLCEKLIGKSVTEAVSDGLLYAKDKVVDFVGDAKEAVEDFAKDAIGKAANVVNEGAKALWGGVKSLFSFG